MSILAFSNQSFLLYGYFDIIYMTSGSFPSFVHSKVLLALLQLNLSFAKN